GANDLLMMGVAGLGVAYHAKPTVQQQASCSISYGGLDGVLSLLEIEKPAI
ncbi:MAG: phosphoserine phosphatase SerB, partial [Gammaproteobacteria bacterium]|nr:phosphoserine phosphatase SerB [Gammaproteobacteria bacterium]